MIISWEILTTIIGNFLKTLNNNILYRVWGSNQKKKW